MFTSQATIERRAAKEARLHAIEERLVGLEAAAAIAASKADTGDENPIGQLQSKMNAMDEKLNSFATKAVIDEANADVTKRLDGLAEERTQVLVGVSKRLDELEAANKEFEKTVREQFASMGTSLSALQSSLEEMKRGSEEVMASLEKRLAAVTASASKPMFPTKKDTSSASTTKTAFQTKKDAASTTD